MQTTVPKETPLCVDLDGSLLKGDSLDELMAINLRSNPKNLLKSISELTKGRAAFKMALAEPFNFEVDKWPLHDHVIREIERAKGEGRRVYLVTGAPPKIAKAVVERWKYFDGFFASNSTVNLTGDAKGKVLESEFGYRGFDYIGNELKDLRVWSRARKAFVIGSKRLFHLASREGKEKAVLLVESRSVVSKLKSILKVVRVHQWVKNILVFLPAVTAHKILSGEVFLEGLTAFFCFSFLASAVYVLNDILDLQADRSHSHKRFRPFASGDLSLRTGVLLIPLFLILAVMLALNLSATFQEWAVAYFALTTAYSFWLKRLVILDVIVLASLYTLRILAGGAATYILVSEWLLAFSMFFFLSLAFIKRYSEIKDSEEEAKSSLRARGYIKEDSSVVQVLGCVSGYLSVLVLALYINHGGVTELYPHPRRLWLACPLLLYWITHLWLIAHRGQIHSDTVVFAAKEKVTYVVAFLLAIVLILARV